MTQPYDHGGLTAAEHLEAALQHLHALGVPAGACELRVAFSDAGTVRRVTAGLWSWEHRHMFGRRELDQAAAKVA